MVSPYNIGSANVQPVGASSQGTAVAAAGFANVLLLSYQGATNVQTGGVGAAVAQAFISQTTVFGSIGSASQTVGYGQNFGGSGPYGIYDPRYFIILPGSAAQGVATATYVPAADFFNSARSAPYDIGATILNAPGSYAAFPTSSLYTDPWGNSVGAGLTVVQGPIVSTTLTTTQMSTPSNFQTAVSNAVSGGSNTILMPGGNYTWSGGGSSNGGGAMLTVAGTASNWIVIKPASGTPVKITGPGLGTVGGGGMWMLEINHSGPTYLDIEGLNLTNGNFGIVLHAGTYIRFYNCNMTQFGNTGFYAGPTNSTVGNYEISYCSSTYTSLNYNSTTGSSGWNGAFTMWGNNVSCMYNLVTFSQGEGIDPQGDNQLIYGNTVYMTGRPGIYNWGNGKIVVDSNFVYQDQANQAAFYANVPVGGVNDSEGISDDNEGSSGSSIPVQYLTTRNNIVWGCTHGIVHRNYNTGSGMTHARWENNTVLGGQTGTLCCYEIDSGTHTDVVVANNIGMWTTAGNGKNFLGGSDGAGGGAPANVTLQNNCWYNFPYPSAANGTGNTGDVNGNPLFHG
jgi:hypothetical protein